MNALKRFAIPKDVFKVIVPAALAFGLSVRNDLSFCSSSLYSKDLESAKKMMVGAESVDLFVDSNTVVGIGDGSTTYYAIKRIQEKLSTGKLENVIVLPLTDKIKKTCISFNIPTTEWDWDAHLGTETVNPPNLDLVISGVDEIDVKFNMIKGGNGSLFREKLATAIAKKIVVICDDSKLSKNLGPGVPLPVEIYPSNFEATRKALEALPSLKGCRAYLRTGTIGYRAHDGDIKAVTDNGNFIIDLYFSKPIHDLDQALKELNGTKGVFCHGLSLNDHTRTANLIVGNRKGVDVITNNSRPLNWWSEIKTKQGLDRQALDNYYYLF